MQNNVHLFNGQKATRERGARKLSPLPMRGSVAQVPSPRPHFDHTTQCSTGVVLQHTINSFRGRKGLSFQDVVYSHEVGRSESGQRSDIS